MKIAATATAYPQYYFSQQEIVEAIKEYWSESFEKSGLLERLHYRTGVDGRYFSRPLEDYRGLDTWGKANDTWIEVSEELGEKAIDCALKLAGLARDRINALFFVSVTGVCSPSIDARLVNRMGLSRNIKRNPIFGLGCVAGAAGLGRAADYVRAYPDHVAALLSVELCSLTWQRNDLSVANLISSGLFGDGAAAVLVAGDKVAASGPRIVANHQIFYPNTHDVMGWKISEKGFTIVLSPDVPVVVRENLGRDVDEFLAQHGLTRADIDSWIMHTGGPKVLEATADALSLRNGELDVSWEALRRVGNLSSASVLIVLDEVMKHRRPAPGTRSILAAMGPGFCAEMLLLEW
ncbi:type III polyketide synthase [Alloacidobacterium sp.]|uniref:type III polyketide synthase n=1 Tax=Alloacidobacterium sp. TaxID=2951999 RepID=UPI002D4788AA|nr:3-oxoacyl-[acyl-carrier-protein] synthase III C-terminal domain-containing protein [Alloacidobacterium sp.]HYK38095.1 3-oxoacyl-[acyl-carrier-protein] synthase III C-terminal domain-containing protein [Alloacidobacterium sp.]